MPKQLNSMAVDVRFQADTSQARQQIQSLVAELNRVGSTGIKSIGAEKLTSELMKAKMTAQDLGNILNSSMNIDTGKLDLNKFNSELKKSGMSLTDYGNILSMIGPEGDKAFLQVAQSIIETQTPLRRTNGLLKEFGTTLANTARWQISSSVLHGFMGAIQSAYGYAKDLNRSLNDIRIVTSANTDEMAAFAEKANKAAKALSATTTDYTKASLIYYQQGLNDEEVAERTEVTIKMANAAGQSAETVSEQLTAIWNNFDDGSKSLEYYADVMTALGAATASSTDEIAGGLEKFAAIGETIGLSYEYAASALATITSNTRQSEEVVGTALKTIFARIQGLKMGETLEDGLDLNKYSEALQAVGISIFDSAGELRKMDDILDDMASKWEVMSKAQQAALAQTVAGTRQYTQLVALMENWNNGDNDSMMANLDTAYGSSGALQEQADIYAESWEASEDRVRAAAEGIYQSLIDEDFFIGINNTLETTLTTIDKMIDAFGGIQGVLGLVGVLVTKIFSNQISQGINNALHNFQVFTGAAEHGMNRLQQEARDYAKSMTEGLIDSPAVQAQRDHLENTFTIQEKLKHSVKGLTEEQIKASEAVADTAKRYSKMAMEAGQAVEKVQELTQAQLKSSQDKVGKGAAKRLNDSADIATGLAGGDLIREAKSAINIGEGMGNVTHQVDAAKKALSSYISILKDSTATEEEVATKGLNVVKALGALGDAATGAGERYTGFQTKLADSTNVVLDAKDKFEDLQENIDTLSTDKAGQSILDMIDDVSKLGLEFEELKDPIEKYKQALKSGKGQDEALKALTDAFKKVKISAEAADKAIVKHATSSKKAAKAIRGKREEALKDAKAVRESAQAERNAARLKEETAKKVAALDKELKKAQQSAKSFGTGFTTGLQAVSSFAMGVNSLKSAFDALNDPDMSTFEKFTSVLMSLGMGIPSVLSGLKGLGTAFKDMKAGLGGSFNALMANVMGLNAEALAQDQVNDEKKEAIILSGKEGKEALTKFANSIKSAAATALEAEAEEELNEEKLKGTGLSLGYIAMKKMEQMASAGGTAAKIAETGATNAAKLAQMGLNAALAPFIGLMLAAVAAIWPYVAAAGALAAAVWFIVDAYNADAEAAKNAQAQVDSLTTQFDECTTAAEELKKTISSWEEGITALEQLDHSTEEYKNKLKEVNAEARKLIETYGLYDDYTVEDGIIKFNEGVLENIQNQADAKVAAVETQLNAAKIISNNANIKSQGTDLGRSMGMMYDAQMSQYSAQSGGGPVYRQASSAEMQSFADAIGGIIDKVSADLPDGEKFELDVTTIRQHLEEGVSGLPQIIQDNLSTLSDEDIQAVLDFRNSMIEATEANKYYAEQVMGVSIEDKYGKLYETAATKDGKVDQGLVQSMINAGTKFASENIKVDGKDLETTLAGIDVSKVTSNKELDDYGYDIQNDKDLALTYAKDVLGWKEEDVSYSGGTGKGTITNVTGDQSFELNDDFMRQALAQQAEVKTTTEAFNAELDATMQAFNEAMTSTVVNAKEGIGQIIVDAAGSEDKKIDFNKMMSEISPDEMASFAGDGSDLIEKLGLNDADLQAMGLASGEEFIKGFQEAGQNYDAQAFYDNMKEKAASSAASQAQDAGFSEDEIADISDYAKHLMEVADESEELSDDLDENAEAAADLAVQVSKMNRGIDTLADNFDDWNDILKKSSKSSAEYSKAMSGMKKALSDVLDVEEDFISADFVTDNLEDIEKAATGDAAAIDRLHAALAKQIVLDIVGVDKFEDLPANLQTALNNMQNLIDNTKLDIGESIELNADGIDETGFIDACNEIIKNANMTAEQANAYFDALGFETQFKTEEQPIEQKVPKTKTVTEVAGYTNGTATGPDGEPRNWEYPILSTYTYTDGYANETGTMEAIAMSTDGNVPQIEKITKKATGSMNNYSGSNSGGKSPGSGKGKKGGGGSTKPTSDARKSKDDYVKRYEQIEDKLDNLRDAMDKAANKADRLWGPARLKEMKNINKMLLEEIDLLEQQTDEAKNYLDLDRNAVESTGGALGLSFIFDDETGDITNIESQLTALFNSREALLDSFGAEMDESEQKLLDDLDKKIEKFQNALDKYRETKEKVEDLEKERQEKIYEWQDNNYEQLNYKLEFEIEINESELEKIDYYLGKIEGNIYAAGEAWGYMGQQVDIYTDSLVHQNEYAKQLEADYYAGKISMEAYKEGLKNCQSATIENLQALQEQKKAMQEYYGEVMEMAIEEITIYTDEMENLNSVLDHYSSILDLVGKKEDYATKKKILNSKATNLRNEMQVQKNIYEESSAEAEKWAEKMANAVVGSNEYETYKKNWQAAQEAANDAQDAMLSKTEEWAETMKLVIENEFAELADIMEESITGGTSFNELLTSMERRSSLQEEYLTTTNQIYETNKMMRTAQQEIDKTSNSVAKRRLKSFIDETAQMQNQTKLSKYELDIQQAKYDLLLAEIALEEAQNSKSTVRLQRDSEGNFGYVYTADQDAVNNAEQNLADKQNALYNIGLEGANNYSQKYAETLQEAQDAITELTEMWMNGEIESEEEYQRRKAEIQEYYYEKLKQYSGLYQVALTTDSNVIKDAWSTDFNDMIYQTENWKDAVDDYFAGAAESMQEWTEVCNTALQESGLDDVNKVIGEIDDKSQKLTTTLIGEDGESGVVGAMMAEVEAAGLLSEQYISIQNEIDNVITKYEELLEELNKKYTDPNTPVVEPKLPDEPPADDGKDDDKGKKYDKTTKRGVALAIWNGSYGWGVGKERRKKLKEKGFDPDEIQALVNNTNPSGGWETRYGITDLKKYAYSKFDTGGYTGDWNGPDGKFAMLHKKELVLNEQDTENFLAGMNILDKIVSIIDLYSINSSLGGMLSSPSLGAVSSGSEALEQSVRIEASFPNVTERNEIEEAFTNLINKASQFANRK